MEKLAKKISSHSNYMSEIIKSIEFLSMNSAWKVLMVIIRSTFSFCFVKSVPLPRSTDPEKQPDPEKQLTQFRISHIRSI